MSEDRPLPHQAPPSAAGHLEPYGSRISIEVHSGALEPERFLTTFLEELAAACLASGASVIGHIKCLLHTPHGAVACNLTSVRSGARCTGSAWPPPGGRKEGAPETRALLAPGERAHLDLAVLVYGLPAAAIDGLLRGVLQTSLGPLGVTWVFDQPREQRRDAT